MDPSYREDETPPVELTIETEAIPVPDLDPARPERPKSAPALLMIFAFVLGFGGGYLLWGRDGVTARADTAGSRPAASNLAQNAPLDLVQQVNPKEGFAMPVRFGNIGPQLLSAGVIDYGKFAQLYEQAGQPLTPSQQSILLQGADLPVVFDRENAYFLLNFFWALGLANQNPILLEGPIMQYGPEQIDRFASTGGWTIGTKPVKELFAKTLIVPLTPAQQARLDNVTKNVFRPCCDNPTHFPDCNHGMAMLGFLTLMASQDATESEMFEAAKYANAFWYPQQSFELAVYFKAGEGLDFADVDGQKVVSAGFSSGSGFQAVRQALAANGLLGQPPQGGGNGCGV